MLDLVLAVVTFVGMEGVAWGSHRFLMHGPLWFLHRTHHARRRGLEANDLFAVFFAGLSAVCVAAGVEGVPGLFGVGTGMAAYGLAYFLLHDVMVHRRVVSIRTPRSGYLARLVRAHRLHHASNGSKGSYGFLWVPPAG